MFFNPISTVRTEPDLILRDASRSLSSAVKRLSVSELLADMKIMILDLSKLWDGSPALSGFARG